ncbi:MAG: alpha/beta hydrolase family esterase [Anaerolineales bacterium]
MLKKKFLLVALLLSCSILISACRLLPANETQNSSLSYDPALISEFLNYNDVKREVLLYVPFPLPRDGVALVIMLHAEGDTPEIAMRGTTEGHWNELAFREKFIVVYPEGFNRRWNDCRADLVEPLTTEDDVGFILAVLDWLGDSYQIDYSQVFVAGHSNGGMMAMRLALEAPQAFRAIFSNNGPLAANSECTQPTQTTSVMFLAGTEDPIIPYEGGKVGLSDSNLGRVLSAEDTVNFWLNLMDIQAEADITEFRDRESADESSVTRFVYKGSKTALWFYQVAGGGHAWPGEEPFSSLEQQTNGTKNQDINAVDEAWSFFMERLE